LLALAHGIELLMQRNGLWSLMVFCAAVLTAIAFWRWQWACTHGALRLDLRSDGTVRLATNDGPWMRAAIRPHSLRLGRHWMLVLVTEEGRRHRILVGRENLQGAEWAALGRWLRRPPADPLRLR
jgi:hypothetical protein